MSSSGGFSLQNGAGETYTNGLSQNPVALYPSNQGYIPPPQPAYLNNMLAKPPTQPPGLHTSFQQPSPVSISQQSPLQSALPNHRTALAAPSQGSPSPLVSGSYYQHPQQPPSWQYGGTPPAVANHLSSALGPAPQQPSRPYSSGANTPPVFQNTVQLSGPVPPRASLNHTAMPAMNAVAPQTHHLHGPPPAAGAAGTPPPPGPPAAAVLPPPLGPHNNGSHCYKRRL